ncbi:acetylornithine deacetylase [Polaromonas sp. YR568]|uniref:acetylornithine deacetylase n=1 Tax=Polaromonas sp. YR568 TaxID=1855301 RepID=UPI0008E91624|nr:acetylornithine deacetylase [Polaromonas sp. YR568]SFV03916.1 acetylornithine deacetylase [Polaromonas sp. YR568]
MSLAPSPTLTPATLPAVSPHALQLIQALVRMNTVSDNSNLELIHFVRDELKKLGVASRITTNAAKTKANLFATLGEGKPAGIILSGHTDTVPWDGQDWTLDPLSAAIKDGRLYGRGSCDMKGFIGMALAHAGEFMNSQAPFAVHLALSYDEEVGCLGVRELIADMKDAGIAPLACIVGEPTSMVPATAHKGVYRYKCCVRGKEAHSSLTPQSVNAIEMAARVVGKLRDMGEGFEANEPRYEGFDVPFSTTSVGQFHGGIADNVVPRDAEFRYEFRNLPTADAHAMQKEVVAYAERAQPAMKKIAPDAGFSFETICEVPAFLGSAGDAVTQLAQRLARTKETTLVAFGTEAGLFKDAGIPTVVCGPGSINQAHQPDEYVSLEQLARCQDFMHGLLATRQIA